MSNGYATLALAAVLAAGCVVPAAAHADQEVASPQWRRWQTGTVVYQSLAGVGGGMLVREARTGYPVLPIEAVLGGEDVPAGFYTATGGVLKLPPFEKAPEEPAFYRLDGPEGVRYLTPFDSYQGRLIVLTRELPPTTEVRVTGRLRTDLRTVVNLSGGKKLPFLAEHRRLLGAPDDARIYFLDTSERAGANVRTVALVLVPGYLALLLMGVATREP